MHPDETRGVREAEQRESAAIVGVEQVEFLGLADGVLEYGVALRRVIAREVRRHRPDVVLTNNFRPTWDGATILNQADHMVTGQATLDAVRDAANRWVFTDLADEGLEPWSGVRAGVGRRIAGLEARRRRHGDLRQGDGVAAGARRLPAWSR